MTNPHRRQDQNMLAKAAAAMTALAAALFHLHVSTAAAALVEYKCTNQDEYYYAEVGGHCSSYYKCEHGQQSRYDCPTGSVFNFYKQSCSRNAGVCYEPVCTGRSDGIYPDTTHACRRAFTCQGGRLTVVSNCPHGHLHNGQSCLSQDFVTCDLPETTAVAYPYAGDRRCSHLSSGYHAIGDSECRKYLLCQNNEVIDEKSCSISYKFDATRKRCVPASEMQSCPNSNYVKTDYEPCAYLQDGFHPDVTSDDCRSYIKCNNRKLVARLNCGSQGVFNGISCVPRPLYQCPGLENDPTLNACRSKPNGFHIDARRGCRFYVKCTSHRTIESLQCPIGQHFDPYKRSCIPERVDDNLKCQDPYPSNDCNNKPLGYYQDASTHSSCREYYFCFNGNKTFFRCPSEKVFDGENCVDKKSYICPGSDPNSCDLKANGYYKDHSGGCRAYYYCSDGKKFTYLCGEDQTFDGTKCILKRPGQSCGREECLGRPDGYYQDIATRCRNYYYCIHGEKITTLTCHGSKIFNGNSCVSADSYNCPTSATDTVSNCISKKCGKECKKDGFYMDIESGCSQYYFCIAGKKTVLSCSEGYVFNGDLCVSNKLFQCSNYCLPVTKCPVAG